MGRARGGSEGNEGVAIWYSRFTGQVSPTFHLDFIRLTVSDGVEMDKIICKRLKMRVWRELSKEEAAQQDFVSREFITWDSSGNARATADLSHLSDHYEPIRTTNTTLEGFSASLLPGDYLISMDLSSGYNHFRLHPGMRKYFTVSVQYANGAERYFQYIALPFGWSRSGYWFCRLVERFWTMVRKRLSYRVLSYVDDFAIAPSMGLAATSEDCQRASLKLEKLLKRYRLTRHPDNGVCGMGSQIIHHLGFVIDTTRGMFGVPVEKALQVEQQAKKLLVLARKNRRRVPKQELARFIGKAQSLRLVVPETAFKLRALYDSLN